LAHQIGWSGYLVGGLFFLKRYAWDPEANYPDNGCNLEIFTNARMLELESVGPLTELGSGESLEHVEHWELHDAHGTFDVKSEQQIHQLLEPIVSAPGSFFAKVDGQLS
jgi:hypothetical protein